MKEKNTREAPECECEEVHTEHIATARAGMPEEGMLYDLADFFKILGDSTRINILFALDRGPLCVCDIAAMLGMTKSAVSHQLKSLRQNGLVSYKKSGKNVFYSLADEHVKSIIEVALEHLSHI
ncbi:MAG: winged helix-turn-helix transcriptional regulator [Clostridia bacterium]|nr:winged helix-turn-helix transcriptional regulator [Clostridia bacterium]